MRSFLVLVAIRQACGECWGADISSFSWCTSYADAGFSCSGNTCAVESCDAPWLPWSSDCTDCAIHYPDAVLHAASGRCCDKLSEDGSCEGPKEGLAPRNEDYGYPDGGIRPVLILEGAVGFPKGAPVWDDQPDGAYAWTWNPPLNADGVYGKKDADCPAFPDDVPFDASKVRPASLNQHGQDGINICFLSCDISEIEKTGVDPCAAGSRPDIGTNMSCYYGGEGWLTPNTMGVCGYPCFMINQETKDFCTQADADAGKCGLTCDLRDLDEVALRAQTFKTDRQSKYLLV